MMRQKVWQTHREMGPHPPTHLLSQVLTSTFEDMVGQTEKRVQQMCHEHEQCEGALHQQVDDLSAQAAHPHLMPFLGMP